MELAVRSSPLDGSLLKGCRSSRGAVWTHQAAADVPTGACGAARSGGFRPALRWIVIETPRLASRVPEYGRGRSCQAGGCSTSFPSFITRSNKDVEAHRSNEAVRS